MKRINPPTKTRLTDAEASAVVNDLLEILAKFTQELTEQAIATAELHARINTEPPGSLAHQRSNIFQIEIDRMTSYSRSIAHNMTAIAATDWPDVYNRMALRLILQLANLRDQMDTSIDELAMLRVDPNL